MKVTHMPPAGTDEEKKRKASPLPPPLPGAKPIAPAGDEISEEARVFQKTTELVKKAPDIRAEKVAAMKKKVDEGTYKLDAAKVADALVDEHLATDFGKNEI